MQPLVFLILIASLVFPVQDKKEDKKSDKDLMQGTWKVTGFAGMGQEVPAEALEGMPRLVIKNDTYTFKNEENDEEGTFKLDPDEKPKEIEFDIKAGQDKGKKQLGIYQLDGDTLKLCLATAGSKERPKELSGKDEFSLFTLKRERKTF